MMRKNGMIVLNINEKYRTEIMGFGEVYEIESVERLRRRLKRKYGDGVLFLAPNRDHSGKGLTLEEIITYAKSSGFYAIEFGYVDAPPWPSRKRRQSGNMVKYPVLSLTRKIFYLLLSLERLMASRYRAHMVYVLSKENKKSRDSHWLGGIQSPQLAAHRTVTYSWFTYS